MSTPASGSRSSPTRTGCPWSYTSGDCISGIGPLQVQPGLPLGALPGERELTLGADIDYKAGEVHVINHDRGWNLVTKGKQAYEWETGATEGLITKLTDEDLIDYLIYQTDPSCIMTCFYHHAHFEPGKFLPPKEVERGCIERRFKEPVEGLQILIAPDDYIRVVDARIGPIAKDKE